MAEIAIPLIILGGLYLVSNNETDEKKEGYRNLSKINHPNIIELHKNIDINNETGNENNDINKHTNPNQHTDKYFTNVPTQEKVSRFVSLTGDYLDDVNFKHNNMVPFFGAKIKGSNPDRNESNLDYKQGTGSQHITKQEQAPMFAPQENLHFANGMPNMSEFYLSRQNPSQKISNTKPWEEERVGPGLNMGYTSEPSKAGYNAGSESRDKWLPRNVDELRVDTNPKMAFKLNGHEGPAISFNKEINNLQTHGRIEKNRPDTDYLLGKDRWFTSTGIEKKQTARGLEVLRDVNRIDTTQEYYGNTSKQTSASYVDGEYAPSLKQNLPAPNTYAPSASNKYMPSTGDYGNGSFNALPNNRSTVEQENNFGNISSTVKAFMSPILDVLRPSKKENVIGNLRPSGNAHSIISKQHIYNPNDVVKTTIREQTENLIDNNHLNVQNQSSDAYTVTEHQTTEQQRDTTAINYIGNAGPSNNKAPKTYNAEYNQRNNNNKPVIGRINQGNSNNFNSYQNININKNDNDLCNNRTFAPSARINNIPSVDTFGSMRTSQTYSNKIDTDRINSDLLNAFKANPYTHSLTG